MPLVVLPIVLGEMAVQSTDAASIVLLTLDPELWPEPSDAMLSQAFGLTQTEAEVAIGVVSGKTLPRIAADRGVKVGTIRAHLKAIFSKTDTRNQADLTRVLTRLAFLMPPAVRIEVAMALLACPDVA